MKLATGQFTLKDHVSLDMGANAVNSECFMDVLHWSSVTMDPCVEV